MVTNCANPACAVPLRYLRDGRLFQFEVRPRKIGEVDDNAWKTLRKVARFWLCGRCSSGLTLKFDPITGVTVTPVMPLVQPEILQSIGIRA